MSALDDAIERRWQSILDMDDRNSPEEYPDMVLLTFDEFRSAVTEAINTPEMDSFTDGVMVEAAHQRERWGEAHDRDKSADAWFWLVGYLSGKALRAAIEGDREKALHHTISAAAALFQWHEAIKADTSGHGVGTDADLNPEAKP